jgi:hypothetical protein
MDSLYSIRVGTRSGRLPLQCHRPVLTRPPTLEMCHGFARNYGDLVGRSFAYRGSPAHADGRGYRPSVSIGSSGGWSVSGNRILPVMVSGHSELGVRDTCQKRAPSDADALLSWYKRSELGSRIAIFFSLATSAGAFSA